jgi:hypothetical protein
MLPEAATTDQAARKPKRRTKVKQWLTKRQTAAKHGVSPRTIDRWVELGILEPPRKVRQRCYFDGDAEPRTDALAEIADAA